MAPVAQSLPLRLPAQLQNHPWAWRNLTQPAARLTTGGMCGDCLQRSQLGSPVPSSILSLFMWVGRALLSCLPPKGQELLLWSL